MHLNTEQSVFLIWIAALSCIGFLLFGLDKRRAVRGAWRIPERTLLLSAFLGGAPGALFGMHFFRHKTQKWKFRIPVPLALLLWGWLAYRVFA